MGIAPALPHSATPFRIERWLGPLPGLKEARAFGWVAIVGALVACGLSLFFGFRGETFMGRPLGGDFVQFYAVGKILNEHPPARIYDVEFLTHLEHASSPTMDRKQMLIFGNAPYIGQLFRPFALLPYRWAYCVWLAFSLVVYAAGLMLLFRKRLPGPTGTTAFLLALSAPMYTLETWIGGQLSIFALLAVAVFVRCLENKRYWAAGLALGCAAYKPSLLAIPAAMMIISASWSMLAGLCASVGAMALASIATVGLEGCRLWLLTLRVFSFLATEQDSVLRRTKYVDFNSFFAMLLGSASGAGMVATLASSGAFLWLAWTWWKAREDNRHDTRCLLWAATLAWTLVVNLYVPVYDTILLEPVIALAVTRANTRGLQLWILPLYMLSWMTQSAAEFLHVQVLTLLIAGFAAWLTLQPRRLER
jgi:glycosyl transferase family 87